MRIFAAIILTILMLEIMQAPLLASSIRGHASAEIVAGALSSTCGTALNFGTIGEQTAGGTITITPDNQRKMQGNVNLVGTDFTRGVCNIYGDANKFYNVTIPQKIEITVEPTSTLDPKLKTTLMAHSFLAKSENLNLIGTRGKLSINGQDRLFIGGTLIVPAKAHPGQYKAVIPITVSY